MEVPLRMDFKPDRSSSRRGAKLRGVQDILMPTIRETEVAFTAPTHVLGPGQVQLKTAPADRGSFFAGEIATKSAETVAYYYISAVPGSQLVVSTSPYEGTSASSSVTRLPEEGEEEAGESKPVEMTSSAAGMQSERSPGTAFPDPVHESSQSRQEHLLKLSITRAPTAKSTTDAASSKKLAVRGDVSMEQLLGEDLLPSDCGCSSSDDEHWAGSSLPSSGQASPCLDAPANAARARLALHELLFGDGCGAFPDAAESSPAAASEPGPSEVVPAVTAAGTSPSPPAKRSSLAWPPNPFTAAAQETSKAEGRPSWLSVSLKQSPSRKSPSPEGGRQQAICVRSDSAFRELGERLMSDDGEGYLAGEAWPNPEKKSLTPSAGTAVVKKPVSAQAEHGRPSCMDAPQATTRRSQTLPVVQQGADVGALSLAVQSLGSLEAEIQQRRRKLDMLVAVHGAWCQALQQPADGTPKVGSVTADDSAHVSSASDSASERSCASCSSLESEYTADVSELEPASPPPPVAALQLPSGAKYHGQLSSQKSPHGLGSYELCPANADQPDNGNAAHTYQGQFFEGQMHGFGVYCFADGGWYAGQWTQGRQQGYGIRVFASGTACLGSFGRAGCLTGGGACFYPSGDSFQGEFKAGVPHGRGQHKAADGSTYAGSFSKGRRSGLGVYHFASGDSFAGTFKDDRPCGVGIYMLASGERLEAQFEEGCVHGFGIRALPTGRMAAGMWRHGKLFWSRLLHGGMDWEDLADADAEGIDLAQEIARNARHSAELAGRAAAVAQAGSSGAAVSIRTSLAAAERAETLCAAAARVAV